MEYTVIFYAQITQIIKDGEFTEKDLTSEEMKEQVQQRVKEFTGADDVVITDYKVFANKKDN